MRYGRRNRNLTNDSTMRRAAAPLALLVAAALGAPPAGAQGPVHTVRTSDGFITSIGSLRMSGPDGGTLARATAVFGRPSRITPIGDGSDACRVEWRGLRFKATFANFGAESACAPQGGRLQTATVTSSRFRTSRGVRVGSASSTIPVRHRSARFADGAWQIARARSPFGDAREIPTIRAKVRAGRVSALELWVGAAGD